jgi:hypothetical protein
MIKGSASKEMAGCQAKSRETAECLFRFLFTSSCSHPRKSDEWRYSIHLRDRTGTTLDQDEEFLIALMLFSVSFQLKGRRFVKMALLNGD